MLQVKSKKKVDITWDLTVLTFLWFKFLYCWLINEYNTLPYLFQASSVPGVTLESKTSILLKTVTLSLMLVLFLTNTNIIILIFFFKYHFLMYAFLSEQLLFSEYVLNLNTLNQASFFFFFHFFNFINVHLPSNIPTHCHLNWHCLPFILVWWWDLQPHFLTEPDSISNVCYWLCVTPVNYP